MRIHQKLKGESAGAWKWKGRELPPLYVGKRKTKTKTIGIGSIVQKKGWLGRLSE